MKRKEKLFGYVAFLLLIGPFIDNIIIFSNMNSVNTWQVSEWLISYSGGFVRRGLGGEIIYIASIFFSTPPSILIVLISILSYITLAYILAKKSNNVIPIYILLSPILLGMPIYNNFLVRKDVLGVLCLLLILIIMKRRINLNTLFLVNVISILATLNHETFIFFGIPMIAITYNLLKQKKIWHPNILIIFSPTLLISAFVIIFHGTPEISKEIIEAWNFLIKGNFSDCCYLVEAPAIEAIGMTLSEPSSLAKSVLSKWSWIFYVPLMWVITWCISILIIGKWAIRDQSLSNTFYTITIMQTIIVFPLFFIGWDFGRWMFFIFVSSISWVSVFRDTLFNVSPFFSWKAKKIVFSIKNYNKIGICLLFITVPSCCWTLQTYLKHTPFFANYGLVSNVFTGYSLKQQHKTLILFIKRNTYF